MAASTNHLLSSADFVGFVNHPDVAAKDYTDYVLELLPLEAGIWIFKDGASYDFTRLQFSRKYSSFYRQNVANDLFYGRVWVTELLEFGLISELSVQSVNLWNANLDISVQITGFSDPGDAGISIETVTIPSTILTNADRNYDVTVFTSGPAEQNTTYEFTVAGISYEVLVTGSRLILFDFDLNWDQPERIVYEYFTSIYAGTSGHEFRRSLVDKVTRRNSLYFTFEGLEAHRYLNTVRYGRSRFILVPIYNELFFSKNALTGAVAIEGVADLTYHWNLQNYASYLLIVDHANKISEAKSIESILNNVITISKAILNTFNPATAVIYPAFVGMVQDYSYRNVTSQIIESKIAFQEVRPNAG
jgi:hypothetical protein